MARLLLVDDDNDIRELGRALLSHAGYDVQIADSAMAALELLRSANYDVLITDANMPVHSGFDLLKMLKSEPRFDDLTKVMLTGRRERRDVEAAVGAGVGAYIVKPLDPVLFLEKIAELLARKPARDPWLEDFNSVKVNEVAGAKLPMEVTAISPLGVAVLVNHPLRPGAVVEVDCELFVRIGIQAQRTRVFACRPSEKGGFEARLSFVDLSGDAQKTLKTWTSNGGRHGKPQRSRAA